MRNIQGFEESELHLPFGQICKLSIEQLFAGHSLGKYASYGFGPRQLRHTQAVVALGSCRPFHAPLVSWCYITPIKIEYGVCTTDNPVDLSIAG